MSLILPRFFYDASTVFLPQTRFQQRLREDNPYFTGINARLSNDSIFCLQTTEFVKICIYVHVCN